ncbi:MAG: non-histone chromosomal MC1 family protein [Haloquadratum sp.]
MVREDGKRNFVMLEDGEKTKQFTGQMPRQAALKAARRLDGYESDETEAEAKEHPTEIRLLERGTDRVHVYDAWAWHDSAPEDKPGWMKENDVSEVTRGNVSKQGIEHLET